MNPIARLIGYIAEAAAIIIWGSILAISVVGMIPNTPTQPAYLAGNSQIERIAP